MRATILALVCGLAPMAAQAQSFVALNHLTVVPLNATDFEVIEARGEGARGIWCAAADFVTARGAGRAQGRLYVKSPRGPSISGLGSKGVVFTTNPDGLQPITSYSVSVRKKGLNLGVNHAIQFCQDYLFDLDKIGLTIRIRP